MCRSFGLIKDRCLLTNKPSNHCYTGPLISIADTVKRKRNKNNIYCPDTPEFNYASD